LRADIAVHETAARVRKRTVKGEVMNRILLIVEDERDMQELMKRYLRKAGIELEVHSAYDGKEGVALYQQLMNEGRKPNLVSMDLKLPELDGVEATKRIRAIDPKAVIFGFTAFFDTDWAERLMKAGATKIIPRYVGFDGYVKELRNFFTDTQ
jgi:two-component system chemotaxis response regulator CheY